MKILKKSFIYLLFVTALLQAKPPELTPQLTKVKIEELLNAHIVHKTLSDEVIKKTLQNYINELDPSKTYLLHPEIEHWHNPSDATVALVKNSLDKDDFSHFKEVYETMLSAIERRNSIEGKIASNELPNGVKPSEFAEMEWTASWDELQDRILRIRGLQAETAEKIDADAKELMLKRLEKHRKSKEEDFTEVSQKESEQLVLSYVLKAVASALDTHTVYFTPQEANQFMIHVQQRLYGIGAQLRDDLTGLTIVSLLEGGPAKLSNLLDVGDRIIAVDGEPIIGMEITDAVENIRGPLDTNVKLTVVREYETDDGIKENKKLDVDILRKEVVLKETRFKTKTEPFGQGHIGTIRLNSFYQDSTTSSAKDLREEIEKMKEGDKLKGLILDLRGNAGGLLTQAVEVAGLFINRGIVVSIKDYLGNVQHLRNFDNNKAWDGPLIVLINRASASAAEIVAQSLKDYGVAVVVGDDYSFGKGTYQTFTLEANHSGKVNPEGEYKVTRGMYFTVSGKSPQFTGLKSDIEIPGPLSQIDYGERFAKNAIQNDSIDPHFDDQLEDIHPIHRFKLKAVYGKDLQKPSEHLQDYIPLLTANSEARLKLNNNFQAFLEDIQTKDEDVAREDKKKYGQNDLQLEESFNVMKDLILLENGK